MGYVKARRTVAREFRTVEKVSVPSPGLNKLFCGSLLYLVNVWEVIDYTRKLLYPRSFDGNLRFLPKFLSNFFPLD